MTKGDVIDHWLDKVVAGRNTMSQRSLTTIEQHGGIEAAVAAARRRGLHLVQLTDDHGKVLLAASKHAFKTLC